MLKRTPSLSKARRVLRDSSNKKKVLLIKPRSFSSNDDENRVFVNDKAITIQKKSNIHRKDRLVRQGGK